MEAEVLICGRRCGGLHPRTSSTLKLVDGNEERSEGEREWRGALQVKGRKREQGNSADFCSLGGFVCVVHVTE